MVPAVLFAPSLVADRRAALSTPSAPRTRSTAARLAAVAAVIGRLVGSDRPRPVAIAPCPTC